MDHKLKWAPISKSTGLKFYRFEEFSAFFKRKEHIKLNISETLKLKENLKDVWWAEMC